jgi:putative endonuclease
LARNLRARCGELDLLMLDGKCLVVVEVRAHANRRYGGAAASVTPAKQARLMRCAAMLLPRLWRSLQAQHPVLRRSRLAWHASMPPCRFDVVAFETGQPRWFAQAFDLSEHSAL